MEPEEPLLDISVIDGGEVEKKDEPGLTEGIDLPEVDWSRERTDGLEIDTAQQAPEYCGKTAQRDIAASPYDVPPYSGPISYQDGFEPPFPPQAPQENTAKHKRRKLIIGTICAIAALVVALGIGLGVGLGVGLKKNSGSDSTSNDVVANGVNVTEGTGLASTIRGDGQGVLLYYQLANGSIVEDFYRNSSLTIAAMNQGNMIPDSRSVVPTPDIGQTADLAAVSFMQNGTVWRSLFYIDTNAQIRTTNSTALGAPWSAQDLISKGFVASGSPAFTACHHQAAGLRLYYGGAGTNQVNRLKYDMYLNGTTAPWHFDYSWQWPWSTKGGVACTDTFDQHGQQVQEVYGGTHGSLYLAHVQDNGTDIVDVAEPQLSASPWAIGNQCALASATNADRSQSFLFWRGEDGAIDQTNTILDPMNVTSARTGTSWNATMASNNLAAAWPGNGSQGPLVIFESPAGQLQVNAVQMSGSVLATARIPP